MKTQEKHTPGPWESNNGEVTTRQENGRSYRRIAAVQDYGLGSLPEVDEANAQLIACAPEMLAALKSVMVFSDMHQCECREVQGLRSTCPFCQVESAIARATGKAVQS
jgi:hypothetical protein